MKVKEVVKEVQGKEGERRVKDVARKTPLVACQGLLSLFLPYIARMGLCIYLSLLSLFHPIPSHIPVFSLLNTRGGGVKEGKKGKKFPCCPESGEENAWSDQLSNGFIAPTRIQTTRRRILVLDKYDRVRKEGSGMKPNSKRERSWSARGLRFVFTGARGLMVARSRFGLQASRSTDPLDKGLRRRRASCASHWLKRRRGSVQSCLGRARLARAHSTRWLAPTETGLGTSRKVFSAGLAIARSGAAGDFFCDLHFTHSGKRLKNRRSARQGPYHEVHTCQYFGFGMGTFLKEQG